MVRTYPWVTFAKENGNLVITLTEDGRNELREQMASMPTLAEADQWLQSDLAFLNLISYELANSDWDVVPDGEIALVTGIVLSDDVQMDDHGNITSIHSAYQYPDQAIRGEAVGLWLDGKITLVNLGIEDK